MDSDPEPEHPDNRNVIRTYSLEEVAAMVLPPMKSPERWLVRKLGQGEISGYKIGRQWRMTHEDVEDLIARHRNSPRAHTQPQNSDVEDDPPWGKFTRGSWLYHQRYPDGRRRPPYRGPAVPLPEILPLPKDFRKVEPEPPEIIAAMAPLTPAQSELLERVRSQGEVIYMAKTARKTVEALARRGLVTYEAEHVLNERWRSYSYRFTVRPAQHDGR